MYVRILRRQLPEDALPERVPLRHRVALVGHADALAPVRGRKVERVLHDPVDALVGVQLFLNRHLIVGPGLEASADADVQPFRVLAKDDEVDVGRRPVLQRAQPLVQQLHRPIVDVEVELEPRAEQDVAGVAVVGDPRIAERADEHRVEIVAQHRVAVRRNGDAGLQVVVGAPRQHLELERPPEDVAGGAKNLDRFGGDVDADAVSGNNRYAHGKARW
jgi:hypothetical protein